LRSLLRRRAARGFGSGFEDDFAAALDDAFGAARGVAFDASFDASLSIGGDLERDAVGGLFFGFMGGRAATAVALGNDMGREW